MIRSRRPLITAAVLAAAAAALAAPSAARATDAFDPTKATEKKTGRWAKLELLLDEHAEMRAERFIPLLKHTDAEIVAAFGTPTPASSRVLLHYAKGWDEPTNPTPVILVHGAGLTSNHCFADRPMEQPGDGLAAYLARTGRAVFAVTFAHVHGDNFLQAEALADAIARVRHVTGASKVDLVAHSKGGMAARIYLASAGPRWATRYRDDVRRYVMLGTPNGGIDVAFAFPNLNYWILENGFAAPLSWDRYLYRGSWYHTPEQTIYADGAYPGQAQMVARWDDRYGITRAKDQYDGKTTYEGGRGVVSVSRGIDRAIADGGHLIDQLRKKPLPRGLQIAALAGTNPWIMNQVGERRGPSDGLLLVASALELEPMARKGAEILRRDTLHLNHLQLVYDERAHRWVAEVLD